MTIWFNRQLNIYEIYHNGRLVDHAKSQIEAREKIDSYRQLGVGGDETPTVKPDIIIASQDKGKAHCYYIRQLAQEIWLKENGNRISNKITWQECLKKALALHVRKLKALTDKDTTV